jgi:RimJ/RimL family protein N-acetyltransferase
MGLTIRSIEAEEWPLWRNLRLQSLADSPDAFRPTLEEERSQSDEWWIEIIGSTANHPRGGLWIAEEDGEAVGMLFGRLSTDLDVLDVGAMWVAPRFRQMGVAAELLEAAMQWARESGAGRGELWVTEENAVALSFYKKAGFQPTADTQRLREGSHLIVRKLETDL